MRLRTPIVTIRGKKIGWEYPILIQSMTNTDTADADATAQQCMELADAGSEMVRITVNNEAAAEALPRIRQILDEKGYEDLPLIGDFHYNGHKLLRDFPETAAVLDKYRVNPGNVDYGDKEYSNFKEIIEIAIKNDKPVRIGVNWGSLKIEEGESVIEAVVESALNSAAMAEEFGLAQDKIVLSVKMSELQDLSAAYELLAEKMKEREHFYALHLGLTEAGGGIKGLVSSAAALGILLQEGIGDTIRISLTPEPGQSRTQEVLACKELLQAMGLRYFRPKLTSCPGCGRTDSSFFQELAKKVDKYIEENLDKWKKTNFGIEKMKVAVMGCLVNGPGESKHADIAISLPGKGEEKIATVYIGGKYFKTINGENIFEDFIEILKEAIVDLYPPIS